MKKLVKLEYYECNSPDYVDASKLKSHNWEIIPFSGQTWSDCSILIGKKILLAKTLVRTFKMEFSPSIL